MLKPSLDEARKLAASGDYRRIPVWMEIYSDARTPIEVMRIPQGISDHCYMLESAEPQQSWGRYTLLDYDPSLNMALRNGALQIDGAEVPTDNPIQSSALLLRQAKSAWRWSRPKRRASSTA